MTQTQHIAAEIRRTLPEVRGGSFRFWGVWFGRPQDNQHRLVDCKGERDLLRLRFDEGEALSVWCPNKVRIGPSVFRIGCATKIRWEWFAYGRPKTPENFYFEEFFRRFCWISSRTNVDWYEPHLNPRPWKPAVEMV